MVYGKLYILKKAYFSSNLGIFYVSFRKKERPPNFLEFSDKNPFFFVFLKKKKICEF